MIVLTFWGQVRTREYQRNDYIYVFLGYTKMLLSDGDGFFDCGGVVVFQ
jgi:hypothetical protein